MTHKVQIWRCHDGTEIKVSIPDTATKDDIYAMIDFLKVIAERGGYKEDGEA